MKNNIVSEKSETSVSTGKFKKVRLVKGGPVKPKSERYMKGKIMKRLMRPLTPLLMELDKTLLKRPVFNKMMNENTKHGFKGRFPALRIDYPNLKLTKGKLPNPPDLSISLTKPGKLVFNWTDNSGVRGCLASDLLFVGVFNRRSRSWIGSIYAAARSTCRYSLNVTDFRNNPVYVYAGFISKDSQRISTSLFLGEITVF